MAELSVLLVLDLVGTFAFALNGALTAVRAAHLDIVGVITLGVITAVGGGGGLLAFLFSPWLSRFNRTIDVLDAAGLSLFAVAGAAKALEVGVGPVQAILLGAVTAVGGGTVRDVLIQRIPSVLSSGLYAIPALAGALVVVAVAGGGLDRVLGAPVALGGAGLCFLIRMLGLHLGLEAPKPPRSGRALGPPHDY